MIKKTLTKILETGIILTAIGIGIAGIVQNNSAKGNYESSHNKAQKLYFLYKIKNNFIYYNSLNQKEFLNKGYFRK